MDAWKELTDSLIRLTKALEETPNEDLMGYKNALIKITGCEDLKEIELGLQELKKYEDLHKKFNEARKENGISYIIWSINEYLKRA